MRTSKRIPSAITLWQRHEELILEVFWGALELLCQESVLPEEEDDISEILSVKIRKANFKLNDHGRGLTCLPIWQGQIAPATETEVGSSFTGKKPDFQCQCKNESAQNAEEAYISYCIECKRLGKTMGSGWNLNKNYVQEGILRFLTVEHSYGKDAGSGTMIGYVQNMDFDSILKEVNQNIAQVQTHKIPLIEFPATQPASKEIINITQKFNRTKVGPSVFNLRHIWVDLRR